MRARIKPCCRLSKIYEDKSIGVQIDTTTIRIFKNLSSGSWINSEILWNLFLINMPKMNGVKIKSINWIKESRASILYSLDVEESSDSQKMIVIGESSEVVDVKKTDKGTFPSLMCVSRPETCPPGTIKTITAAYANKELEKIREIKIPIIGSSKIWIAKPNIRDFFSLNKILNCCKLLFSPKNKNRTGMHKVTMFNGNELVTASPML